MNEPMQRSRHAVTGPRDASLGLGLGAGLLGAAILAGCTVRQERPRANATAEAATVLTLPPEALTGDDNGRTATPADAGAALPVSTDGATDAPRGTAGAVATPTRAPVAVAAFDPDAFELALEPLVEGLDRPIGIQHAGDSSGRLFVVEKAGRVRVVERGALREAPFLDIEGRVGSGASEQGLLGLAFHPRFGEPAGAGRFYVNYTDKSGDTVIAEYRVAPGADRADAASERVLLKVPQPRANHNGGDLEYGPDGYLYAALGDGGPSDAGAGSSDDGRSGDPEKLLGAILRLDVDGGAPYGIPPGNPFVGDPALRDEIWALGLRNPWRIRFDRATGDLYIADVGAGSWEEVDRQPAASRGGTDYGWPEREGSHCRAGGDCAEDSPAVPPVLEYSHDEGGCSITGGQVYRGRAVPALAGVYLFGDYCSGQIWAGWRDAAGAWQRAELDDTELSISSFGEDEAGEVYVADMDGGTIYRIGTRSR
jgi:glucose/arabinose dehydrogenase